MPEDPVATASQHEQELAALELIGHPTVKAAYRTVAETWLGRAKASDAMRERFDDAFAEVMFSAAVWSSNQDKLRPKVSCITRLGHPVDGRRIPGSRWGIDNPDSVYRVIPISGDERYEIQGRVGKHRMTENYFTLWDAQMGTVDVLNGRTMQVDSDGSFTITVDADPANGRPNHVQTSPAAHEFYIRDVLLDWGRDDPNQLDVQRLGGPPETPARTLDKQAEATAGMMAYFANFTGKLSHGVYKMPPNHFDLAWSADKVGAPRWISSMAPAASTRRSPLPTRTAPIPTWSRLSIPGWRTGSTRTGCARASSRCGWRSSARPVPARISAPADAWSSWTGSTPRRRPFSR